MIEEVKKREYLKSNEILDNLRMRNLMNEIIPADSDIICYRTANGKEKIEVKLEEVNVWLSQKGLVELYQTSKQNISLHLRNIFISEELSVIRKSSCQVLLDNLLMSNHLLNW